MHSAPLDYIVEAWLEENKVEEYRSEHILFSSKEWDKNGLKMDLGIGTAFLYFFSTREYGSAGYSFQNSYTIESGKQAMFYNDRNIHLDAVSDSNKIISGHSPFITLHTDQLRIQPDLLNLNYIAFFHALVIYPIKKKC